MPIIFYDIAFISITLFTYSENLRPNKWRKLLSLFTDAHSL